MSDQFEEDIHEMRETGKVYQEIVERFGDRLDVIYVDPRNTISIMDYMFRQLKRRQIGFTAMIKNTFWGSRRGAVFLNGHWMNQASQSIETLVENIHQELGVGK
ncbi:hypothetical protein ACSVDE_00625 [Pseudalkalibacillus sp. Hm43]|uniref:hypothetical protein n=1 Tax=Pseudalkalibacillus sp. Hm43 TaxID=3450742 RepID=UPI003F434FEA